MLSSGLIAALRRSLGLLVFAAVVPAGLVLADGRSAPPRSIATTTVYFAASDNSDVEALNLGGVYVRRQISSFAAMARTSEVLEPVISDLSLGSSSAQLARRLEVTFVTEGFLVEISTTSSSADEAQTLADAVGRSLAAAAESISPRDQDGRAAIRARVIDSVADPIDSGLPWFRAALASAVGLALAGVFILYRYAHGDRIRSRTDVVDITTAPILADLTTRRGWRRPSRRVAHSFERLGVALLAGEHGGPGRLAVIADSAAIPRAADTAHRLAAAMTAAGRLTGVRPAHLTGPLPEGHDLTIVAWPYRRPVADLAARAVAVDGFVVAVVLDRTTETDLVGLLRSAESHAIPIVGIVLCRARRRWPSRSAIDSTRAGDDVPTVESRSLLSKG